MICIKIKTEGDLFIADSGEQTPYSKAQGLHSVLIDQLLPAVACGGSQGKLYDQHGNAVAIWVEK